jgi:hypothetical protein
MIWLASKSGESYMVLRQLGWTRCSQWCYYGLLRKTDGSSEKIYRYELNANHEIKICWVIVRYC